MVDSQSTHNFNETLRQTANLINQDFELHASALVHSTIPAEDMTQFFTLLSEFVNDVSLKRLRDTVLALRGD